MKKEIVIAAHREIMDWMPDDWLPISTIYRCGEPTVSLGKKLKARKTRLPVFAQTEDDIFINKVGHLRELIQLMWELNEVIQSKQGVTDKKEMGAHAERETKNCPHGREAEQWLNHIIWRYDSLAEVTVFLQGHPHDHCPEIVDVVNSIKETSFSTVPFSQIRPAGTLHNEPRNPNREDVFELCNTFWVKLGQPTLEKIYFSPGAQFAASREVIRSRPLSWYEKVRNLSRSSPKSGEALERIWWNIVGAPS